MKVLSLGWGVQSFTIAAMVALGELEPIDTAIHADTTHESKLTYEFAKRWTGWLEEHGVKIITVSPPEERSDPCYHVNTHSLFLPAFTYNGKTNGQLRRQCTSEWKVLPMRRWMSKNINKKTQGIIKQWLGISLDEFQRMRDSDVKYITNRYPLIERKMTRKDCVIWLMEHDLEVPPKSACTFCPYHNTAEWRRIKNTPEDWKEAVSVDMAIRKARPPYDLFVHPSRKPLEEVDFRTMEEKGQLSLWDSECSGICGV